MESPSLQTCMKNKGSLLLHTVFGLLVGLQGLCNLGITKISLKVLIMYATAKSIGINFLSFVSYLVYIINYLLSVKAEIENFSVPPVLVKTTVWVKNSL